MSIALSASTTNTNCTNLTATFNSQIYGQMLGHQSAPNTRLKFIESPPRKDSALAWLDQRVDEIRVKL